MERKRHFSKSLILPKLDIQEEMKCTPKASLLFSICYKQNTRLASAVNGEIDEMHLMHNVSRASHFLGALLD